MRWVLAVATLALIAVVLALREPPVDEGSTVAPSASFVAPASVVPTATIFAAMPREVVRIQDASANDLAIDVAGSALWFMLPRLVPDEPDLLVRIETAAGAETTWPMPPTDGNGFLSEIALATDGAVWLSDGYRMRRFDPASGAWATVVFPLDIPGALNGGADGTWISGFGIDGAGAWVARHNVTTVVRLDASLAETDAVAVGADLAGASDVAWVDDRLFIIRGARAGADGQITAAGIVILTAQGDEVAFAPLQASRLDAVGDVVLARGGPSIPAQTALVDASGAVIDLVPGVGLETLAALTSESHPVIYRNNGPSAAVLERVRDGRIERLATFERRLVQLNSCPLPMPVASGGAVSSGCPMAWVGAPELTGLAVDSTGAAWYLTRDGSDAVLWKVDAAD